MSPSIPDEASVPHLRRSCRHVFSTEPHGSNSSNSWDTRRLPPTPILTASFGSIFQAQGLPPLLPPPPPPSPPPVRPPMRAQASHHTKTTLYTPGTPDAGLATARGPPPTIVRTSCSPPPTRRAPAPDTIRAASHPSAPTCFQATVLANSLAQTSLTPRPCVSPSSTEKMVVDADDDGDDFVLVAPIRPDASANTAEEDSDIDTWHEVTHSEAAPESYDRPLRTLPAKTQENNTGRLRHRVLDNDVRQSKPTITTTGEDSANSHWAPSREVDKSLWNASVKFPTSEKPDDRLWAKSATKEPAQSPPTIRADDPLPKLWRSIERKEELVPHWTERVLTTAERAREERTRTELPVLAAGESSEDEATPKSMFNKHRRNQNHPLAWQCAFSKLERERYNLLQQRNRRQGLVRFPPSALESDGDEDDRLKSATASMARLRISGETSASSNTSHRRRWPSPGLASAAPNQAC